MTDDQQPVEQRPAEIPMPMNTPETTPEMHLETPSETLAEQEESPRIAETPQEATTEDKTSQQKTGNQQKKKAVKDEETTDIRSEDHQVQAITKLAIHKGLNQAIQQARKTKNPYVIDRVHDELVDHLKDQLREEGKLKEIH